MKTGRRINTRSTMTAGLTLLLALALVSCTSAPRKNSQSHAEKGYFQALLKLNDFNERAFAYHRHCAPAQEPINEEFLRNFEHARNLLFDEGIRTMGLTPERMSGEILTRRAQLQKALGGYYKTEGCSSLEAGAARDHYISFGALDRDSIKNVKAFPVFRR